MKNTHSQHNISVCIPTYKRPKDVLQAIASVRASDVPKDWRIHIFVADNDREASSRQSIESLGDKEITYLTVAHQNISLARNALLRVSSGQYVVFLDDDARLAPDCLRKLMSAHEASQADVVHGRVIPIYPPGTSRWLIAADISIKPDISSATNCVSICKNILNRTHISFDPDLGLCGGEDTDFFYQLKVAGAKMVTVENALAYETLHSNRNTILFSLKRKFRRGEVGQKIQEKHGISRSKDLLIIAAGVFGPLLLTPFVFFLPRLVLRMLAKSSYFAGRACYLITKETSYEYSETAKLCD